MAFSFGGAPAAPAAGFTFGGAPAAAAPAATGFNFGAPAAPAGGFAFGGAPAAGTAPATTGFNFGDAAAPAGGFAFGSAPAAGTAPAGNGFNFGAPAAGGAGGFAFSGAPAAGAAPAAGGFNFGAPAAPAAGGFNFGAPAAPAAGGGFAFGAAPSTYGTPTYGAPAAASDALAKKVMAIANAYDPTSRTNRFRCVFYNKQTGGAPPKAHVDLWEQGMTNNPDPATLTPVVAVGFEDLKKRIDAHAHASNAYSSRLTSIDALIGDMQGKHILFNQMVSKARQKHAKQASKLLKVMRKLVVLRARDQHFQNEENDYKRKLETVRAQLPQLQQLHKRIEERVTLSSALATHKEDREELRLDKDSEADLHKFLIMQSRGLRYVTEVLRKDLADMNICLQGLTADLPSTAL